MLRLEPKVWIYSILFVDLLYCCDNKIIKFKNCSNYYKHELQNTLNLIGCCYNQRILIC